MADEKHTCLDCALARWKRTRTGALHPDGSGRCGWKMPSIPIPKAFYWFGHRGLIQQPAGGFIDRKKPDSDCPTWEARASD